MIRTTQQELGAAYQRANQFIWSLDPITPRHMGALWREQFGLHHRVTLTAFGRLKEAWIEFPDDRDYTAFMLRFA